MTPLEIMSRPTLMAFWLSHRDQCRPIGSIIAEARAGRLSGVAELEEGCGFRVLDEAAALAAMRKEPG